MTTIFERFDREVYKFLSLVSEQKINDKCSFFLIIRKGSTYRNYGSMALPTMKILLFYYNVIEMSRSIMNL